jgi:AcrR family transcriptional regulator
VPSCPRIRAAVRWSFWHFPTKAALLQAVLVRRHDRLRQAVGTLLRRAQQAGLR